MKNKKILYLLTIILTLFSFNMNVKAATEMTCVYEMGTQAPKVKIVLIQNSTGVRTVYVNTKDVALKESGWRVANYEIDISNAEKDTTSNLKSCPNSVTIAIIPTDAIGGTKSQLNFYKDDSGKQKKDVTTSTEGQILDITTGSASSGGDDSSVNEDGSTPTNTSGKTCEEINIEDYITFNEDDSIASCVYASTLREDNNKVIGCHIVQVDFKDNDVILKTIDPQYSNNIKMFFTKKTSFATLEKEDIIKQVKEEYNGWCPNRISVNRIAGYKSDAENGVYLYLSYEVANASTIYKNVKTYGKNLVNPEKQQTESNLKDTYIKSDDATYNTCEEMFGDDKSSEILKMLQTLVNIVKIMIPILLIGLGIFDFAKAIFAGSDDKMKKAQSKFIKRVIVGICIFLIPSVLELLLTIANGIWSNISPDFCGIL